jgi:hypothetical protein
MRDSNPRGREPNPLSKSANRDLEESAGLHLRSQSDVANARGRGQTRTTETKTETGMSPCFLTPLHSALTPKRYALSAASSAGWPERRRVLRTQRLNVLVAMGAAGLVNATMLTIAAALFSNPVLQPTLGAGKCRSRACRRRRSLDCLRRGVGGLRAGAPAVGTYAGQIVMAGLAGH